MHRARCNNLKPGLVPGFFLPTLLVLLTACEPPVVGASDVGRPARLSIAGRLQNDAIVEASGLATSNRDPGILWLLNDGGSKAHLYASDLEGNARGRLKLDDTNNRDWEDLSAFVLDDTPYLLVADIGDNDGDRKHVSFYIVEEPDLGDDNKQARKPDWRIKFTYPGGPRDAEAAAVDIANERVLVLSKRELPPVLFAVPLRANGGETQVATRLGEVSTLPRPSRQDIEFAPQTKDWHWQPTGMDLARDGSAAIILTYRAVYYYENPDAVDWLTVLRRRPLAFGLRNIPDAEAIAFAADASTIFVTVEKKNAPLLRIDMGDSAN